MSHPPWQTAKDARFERDALTFLPDVARYALSLTRDQSDADDLVQDTYLSAYRSWDQYRDGSECRAWLFTICRHHFLRTRKREERALPVDDPVLESLAAAALHASAREAHLQDMFERSEVMDAIASAIDELPLPYREVAVMVDVHDQTYDMVAQALEVPIGTVRSRLFRARRILQEKLIAHARDAGLGSATRDEKARQPRSESP